MKETAKTQRRTERHILRTSVINLLILSLAAQVVLLPANILAEDGRPRGVVVSPAEMDRSIDEVLGRHEYAWKLPREKDDAGNNGGILSAFIDGVLNTLRDWLRPVAKSIWKALKWLMEQLSRALTGESRRPSDTGWMKPVKALLYIVLSLSAVALALTALRMRKKSRERGIRAEAENSAVADVSDEDVSADELPPNRWLELARLLINEGELRPGVRALYLACLSHLSERGLITISRFKSDRDYERELFRKAHSLPGMLPAFSENVRIFESVWYGMYEVNSATLTRFSENQRRIMSFGGK